MTRVRRTDTQQWIGAVLLVAAVGLAVVSSCGQGGGGGSSNGELCEQCGDTDGPCEPSVDVTGADADALCPDHPATCHVKLTCLRKLDSSQRRCFPADFALDFFECDGSRANRRTATPTPTRTVTPSAKPTITSTGPTATGLTPTPALTPTASPTPRCGDGTVDPDEECDGTNFDDQDCGDFCEDVGGTLACTPSCTLDFSGCTSPPCSAD